ncbi:hypothetical protein [Parabacteroides sp. FAFU027]|uniref:hypothetical protein n=1 Tax=Parabacteroides sp. FAFU027 TaxID=2922715 RepID=UPI001FAF78B2|nr:hypothetical protein [Parabacteroides sp. FAFU027]
MEKINALALINREVDKRRLSPADVAHLLNMNYSTIYVTLKRKNITVNDLAKFSEAFQYNFFKEIADHYSFAEPAEPVNEEMIALKEKVKDLEQEVNFLRRTLKDLMGK